MLQAWRPPPRPLVVVLMGVTASGKTTAGEALAARWGWPHVDGNDVHPPANVAKMRSGTPLTDADRRPWLEALHRMAEDVLAAGDGAIIGCSALKASDRAILRGYLTRVVFVSLDGELATLDTPSDAVRVDATGEVDAIVRRIAEAVTTWQRNDEPPPPI
jgi:carbohydrate kinase (thermoresistant glucokinase family)